MIFNVAPKVIKYVGATFIRNFETKTTFCKVAQSGHTGLVSLSLKRQLNLNLNRS